MAQVKYLMSEKLIDAGEARAAPGKTNGIWFPPAPIDGFFGYEWRWRARSKPVRMPIQVLYPGEFGIRIRLSLGESMSAPNFGGKHRSEPLPPRPDRFMADVDPALMEQILHIPKRERESDIHHHRQADHFRAALEALERGGSAHLRTLRTCMNRLKADLSVRATGAVDAYAMRPEAY